MIKENTEWMLWSTEELIHHLELFHSWQKNEEKMISQDDFRHSPDLILFLFCRVGEKIG